MDGCGREVWGGGLRNRRCVWGGGEGGYGDTDACYVSLCLLGRGGQDG